MTLPTTHQNEKKQLIMETNEMDAPKSKGRQHKQKTGNKKERHQQTTRISNQQWEKAHKETPPYQTEDEHRNGKEKITQRPHNI